MRSGAVASILGQSPTLTGGVAGQIARQDLVDEEERRRRLAQLAAQQPQMGRSATATIMAGLG